MPTTFYRYATIALTAAAVTLAQAPDAHAQAPDEGMPPEHESPAMMYTGIALSTTGLAGLGVGTGVFFSMANEPGDFAGLAAAIVGGAILIPSSILVHVGIPLWAVGASEPDHRDHVVAVPEVRVGPTGGSLRWGF